MLNSTNPKSLQNAEALTAKSNVFEIAAINGLGMNDFIDYLNQRMIR
jgi:hypothetical protein